ncbi:hypothetical protein J0871_14850 [Salegentibacter sp. BDJ18]|uniref:DUF4870 domain-containing protein n=1 Tax=Salegentibacter sp. BDJ18 TaxID=2816376 RepID=UPI001AAFF6C6|nr:hypothetical protein [Salegentibacter sp. BDJ18]MBO2545699.1 hypothetical protein [Salegentibacter sp. BDJ18]
MENQESLAENIEKTEDKSIGIIAYLTLIGLVAAFIMNKDKNNEFATYHIKQSLGLCLVGFAIFIVGLIPVLGWVASFAGSLCLLVLWIMGLLNAVNGKQEPVPVLGSKFETWFKNM